MLKEVGILPTLVYFLFFGSKWENVPVPIGRPSPRLGQGASLGRKVSLPRRRRCSPRRGSFRLGEPKDKNWGVSGPPRRGFASLGKGRLHLGELMTV